MWSWDSFLVGLLCSLPCTAILLWLSGRALDKAVQETVRSERASDPPPQPVSPTACTECRQPAAGQCRVCPSTPFVCKKCRDDHFRRAHGGLPSSWSGYLGSHLGLPYIEIATPDF